MVWRGRMPRRWPTYPHQDRHDARGLCPDVQSLRAGHAHNLLLRAPLNSHQFHLSATQRETYLHPFPLWNPLPEGPLLPRAAVWIPINRVALLGVRFIGDVVQVHGRPAADLKTQPAELPLRVP